MYAGKSVSQGYIRIESCLQLQCCDRADICNVTQKVHTSVLQPAVYLNCDEVTAHVHSMAATYDS